MWAFHFYAPGPRLPPCNSRPNRNMTALSYSWTTWKEKKTIFIERDKKRPTHDSWNKPIYWRRIFHMSSHGHTGIGQKLRYGTLSRKTAVMILFKAKEKWFKPFLKFHCNNYVSCLCQTYMLSLYLCSNEMFLTGLFLLHVLF